MPWLCVRGNGSEDDGVKHNVTENNTLHVYDDKDVRHALVC